MNKVYMIMGYVAIAVAVSSFFFSLQDAVPMTLVSDRQKLQLLMEWQIQKKIMAKIQ